MNEKKMRFAAVLAAAVVALTGLLQAQNGGFAFRGALGRVITPNGDLRNDYAIFCLDNPSDSGVSGKIYTINGTEVGSMSGKRRLTEPPPGAGAGQSVNCPASSSGVAGAAQFVFWDGRGSNGATVKSGVYVYQIKAEGLSFKGTLVVVR